MQGRRNRGEGGYGIAPPDFGRLVNNIPTKVTPTEETIRENLIDSILHEKNQFCFGQSHKFSTYVILNFELFKNTK